VKKQQSKYEDALTEMMIYLNAFTTACIVVAGALLWAVKNA
jgi:hypothetical protein